VAGSPAVDVEMTYGEDKVVLFQLVSTDEHVMQTLVSGPESEREAVLGGMHVAVVIGSAVSFAVGLLILRLVPRAAPASRSVR
jgi:hypothetical protein